MTTRGKLGYLNRSSNAGITKLERHVPMVTGVTSLMMVYRQERTKGVGAYHIVVSALYKFGIECSSIGGGRS